MSDPFYDYKQTHKILLAFRLSINVTSIGIVEVTSGFPSLMDSAIFCIHLYFFEAPMACSLIIASFFNSV